MLATRQTTTYWLNQLVLVAHALPPFHVATSVATPRRSAAGIHAGCGIPSALGGKGYIGTGQVFEPVAARLMEDEPLLDGWKALQPVTESDLRRVKSAAATLIALAELESRGALLPTGPYDYSDPHRFWISTMTPQGSGPSYRLDGRFSLGLSAGYRLPIRHNDDRLVDLEDEPPRLEKDRWPGLCGDTSPRLGALRETVIDA
jgi:hypothetical protein